MLSTTMMFTAVLALVLLGADAPGAKKMSLAELRQNYGAHYFDPDAHAALAKHYHDQGNRLLAFYMLESARRTRFEQPVFDAAFAKSFHDDKSSAKPDDKPFDNSPEAEKKLLAKYQQNPKDADAIFALADIYISRDDWKQGKTFLNKLIALSPEKYENYEALAEVYRREKDDKQAAEVEALFFKLNPDSVEAFTKKIDPLMKQDPVEAEAVLERAIKKHPEHAPFVFNHAVLLQNAGKMEAAEKSFVKAATLGKDNAYIQSWVGRFFLRARQDEKKSLPYYLNAYFLDPHFRDTEFAEGGIRSLNYAAATAIVENAEKGNEGLEMLLKHDNPVVVGMAIGKLAKSWQTKNRALFVALLGHDDLGIRARATSALIEHADASHDKEIQAMLDGDELRTRGAACYMAVKLWNDKGVAAVQAKLNDPAELVRFDAISALSTDGGEKGREIVREHGKKEKHPWLVKLIKSLDDKMP